MARVINAELLTDSRKARKRRLILDCAMSLMQEKGFHAITMQSVADDAQISVGSIYQYFTNKDELLLAVVTDILATFAQAVPTAVAQAPKQAPAALHACLQACCEVVDANRDGVVLAYRESKTLTTDGLAQVKRLEREATQPIAQVLRDGMASGEFRDLDPDLLALDVLLIAHGWALKHWRLRDTYTLDSYVEAQAATLLQGVRRRDDATSA